MFEVEVIQLNSSIVVKHPDINNHLTVVANGKFAVDTANRAILVVITHTTISSNDTCLLGRFISDVMSSIGKHFSAFVFLRLPMFDGQLNADELKLENKPSTTMAAEIADVRYDDDGTIQYDHEKYTFITDKQVILKYSSQLTQMLNKNAYWVGHLNSDHINDRVQLAKRVVMVLDKANDVPCGFGRLFMMTKDGEASDIMGYLDDIVVENQHHNKRLGSVINNYLMGIKTEGVNGTLCLVCVNEGTGAISAPRIYKKAGFELISDICNRIALFVNEEHVPHD